MDFFYFSSTFLQLSLCGTKVMFSSLEYLRRYSPALVFITLDARSQHEMVGAPNLQMLQGYFVLLSSTHGVPTYLQQKVEN